VLTDIVPERKAEFFGKADEMAWDRVIGGVHFPTDIAAGKVFGDLYHAELLKSEAYRKDIEKMKALLVK
jgi:acid phosphatase (class A)